MPNTLLPSLPAPGTELTDPLEVTAAFLARLADSDVSGAMELVADDIVYTNVGLPTLRGRADVERAMDSLAGERIGFEVYIHSSSTAEHLDGSAGSGTVLNERTDVITIGRFRLQFWVMGRFDVVDGRITLWRDYFDFWDMTKAAARGLAALALPGLAPRPPGPGDSPGR